MKLAQSATTARTARRASRASKSSRSESALGSVQRHISGDWQVRRSSHYFSCTEQVSSGYKEFADFLAKEEALVDTQLSIDSPEYKQAVDAMKTGTRQYARRQIKWIRNQLLPVIEASKADGRMDDVYLYLLDATGRFDPTRSSRQN